MQKSIIITVALGALIGAIGIGVFYLQHSPKSDTDRQQDTYIEKRNIDFSKMVVSKEIQIRSAGDAILAILAEKEVYAYKGDIVVTYEGIMKFGSITNKCMIKIASKLEIREDQLIASSPRLVKFSPYDVSEEDYQKLQEADGVIFELIKEKIKFEPYPLGYSYLKISKIHNTFIEFER